MLIPTLAEQIQIQVRLARESNRAALRFNRIGKPGMAHNERADRKAHMKAARKYRIELNQL